MSSPTARRRKRLIPKGLTGSPLLAVLVAAAILLGVVPAAFGQQSADKVIASDSTVTPAFSATKTIGRVHIDSNGNVVSDDSRQFSVSVSQSSNLRDREVIQISWTGAHPSGGLIANEQGYEADLAEFPVVLMECRGVDAASASTGQQVSPSTCWTTTPNERTQTNSGGVPLWALDYYASPDQKKSLVGQPAEPPAACSGVATTEGYWLPFDSADGTTYPVGPYGCAGEPPGMSQPAAATAADVLPSDTTYAASNSQGTGSSKFSIETDVSNSELGCSETVACTLEVIPIEGISCDPTAALNAQPPETNLVTQCESPGAWPVGSLNNSGFTNLNDMSLAVQGSLWYLPSNWRNRVAVPLSFAPSADVCSSANTSTPIGIYGSELVSLATDQWNPYFCLSPSGFNVNHVTTAEPEAKNLLASGSIEAAFEALPPTTPFVTPTVQAPVALGGWAIAYVIDNGDGTPYTSLKLDARLLAKLLTESYPADPRIADVNGDTAIAGNPLTIFDDPEFKALNPGLHVTDHVPIGEQPAGAGSLYSILGQSDVIYALTSYINSDSEARAWLDGTPDPWGTVVNPAYKGISLPVNSWPLLDSVTKGLMYAGGPGVQIDCLNLAPNPPAIRPQLDAPESTLAQVAFNLQFGISPSLDSCSWTSTGVEKDPVTGKLQNTGVANWNQIGVEAAGARFLIGLVPLALADEYDLDTAALETYRSPSTPARFADATGQTFIAPSETSLQAAASLLQPVASAGSWTLPYSDFPGQSTAAGAYPGTMLVSMDVPTSGLPSQDASSLGAYMSYVAGPGQTQGTATGQLPPGYLPLTSANGLGSQAAYTKAAAADVTSQNKEVPSLGPAPSGVTTATTATVANTPTGGSAGSEGIGTTNGTQPDSTGTSSPLSGSGMATTNSAKYRTATRGNANQPVALAGATPSVVAGVGAIAMPIALAVVLLGLGVAGFLRVFRRKSVGP